MADGNGATAGERNEEVRGWPAVKVVLFENKYSTAQWLLRMYTIGCTLFFLVPLFGSQFSANCFKRVLLSSATISALRLHQRLPRFQFSRLFFQQLIQEDAFHYLCYSVLFIMAHAATLVLIPITLFAVLHAGSFTRRIIDAAGSDNFFLRRIRPYVLKVEDRQTQQSLLQFIASSEIMMMLVTILMLLSAQASFLVPFFYYRFLQLRYTSRRNPYSRLMFQQMRLGVEQLARNPKCPAVVGRVLFGFTGFVSRLAPAAQEQQQQQ
ncbi:transmembrane protein 33-like [Rhopilema esculentum]|uniref:transmembrane protein 33-like n=1 Tax=Rhopilema esculentum TaxID=499914 RepID=UPI0031DC7535